MQEAARRCNFSFKARAEDKTHRWIISDGSLEPTLIAGAGREEGGNDPAGDEAAKKKTDDRPGRRFGLCEYYSIIEIVHKKDLY